MDEDVEEEAGEDVEEEAGEDVEEEAGEDAGVSISIGVFVGVKGIAAGLRSAG